MVKKISTVLFDLDGTLIDTAPDMANALNILLQEQNQPTMRFEQIRPVVSNGSIALVKLGFGTDLEAERIDALKQRYLDIYQQHLCEDSGLFEGMETLLKHIEQNGMRWGVVTNKPGWLTEPLMELLDLSQRASCIVSGDTTTHRKPHPQPMYHACQAAGSQPHECIYIGDARRDIEAGRNAGMQTVIALYGYIGDWEDLDDWGADHRIEQAIDMFDLLHG